MRAARLLVTSPTTSMTTKVKRYLTSETAKVKTGGTKKKSRAATLRIEATSDGPRPYRVATTTRPSRYTITRFASSKNGKVSHAAPVASATTAVAQP